MEKPLTPSPMTDDLFEKIVDNVRAGLRKSRQYYNMADVQQALEKGGLDKLLITETEAVVEQVIAKVANTIVRIATVYRDRKPQKMLDATERIQCTDKTVVASMPSHGTGTQENVEVVFFKLNRCVSDDELEKEYEARGLVSDPYAQAQVNVDDPAFATEHLNGTH